MKNRLTDLNNHLFMQLERLGDEEMSKEDLTKEVERAKAIVGVSDKIIVNAALQIKGAQLIAEHGGRIMHHLPETARIKQIEHAPQEKGTQSDGAKPN